MTNDELYHRGIIGMKWGRHKKGVTATSDPKVRSEKEQKLFDLTNNKKKISVVSDTELKKRIARMQLEKQYADLTKKETGPGKKFVLDLLNGAAKQTLSSYASKGMTKGTDKLIEAAIKAIKVVK